MFGGRSEKSPYKIESKMSQLRECIKHFIVGCVNLVLCSLFANEIQADDWPGLLGPFRSGHSASEQRLSLEGRTSELTPKWRIAAGQGYAGMAVADGKVVLYDRDGNQDRVRYVDLATGKVVWERLLPAKYSGGIDADKGPRCVPTITDRFIVIYSAACDLSLLSKSDGAVLWTRNLQSETGADLGYFGAGSTPLVLRDRIVANVGGKRAGVICVSLADGKDLWTATNYDASYASPIELRMELAESTPPQSILLVPTRLKTIGLDPNTGRVLWETPFGQRGPTVNAATPIACKPGEVFLTASYGIGNVTLSTSTTKVEVVHQGDQLNSQYATPVFLGGWIYGSDGREDMGGATYKCLNASTGKVTWEQSDMPICHTIAIGTSQLLLLGIDGRLWLLEANAEKFDEIWQSNLAPGKYRALPALAEQHLFVRSNNGNDAWMVFDLSRGR